MADRRPTAATKGTAAGRTHGACSPAAQSSPLRTRRVSMRRGQVHLGLSRLKSVRREHVRPVSYTRRGGSLRALHPAAATKLASRFSMPPIPWQPRNTQKNPSHNSNASNVMADTQQTSTPMQPLHTGPGSPDGDPVCWEGMRWNALLRAQSPVTVLRRGKGFPATLSFTPPPFSRSTAPGRIGIVPA